MKFSTLSIRLSPPLFLFALLLLLAFAFRLAHIFWKFDSDWEPDCYQHILFSKTVVDDFPANIHYGLHVWAKPLYTYFMAFAYFLIPDSLPLVPVTQIINSCLWLASCYLLYTTARPLFSNPFTPVFIAVSFLFTYSGFRASVSSNTEPMGAFLFALALSLFFRKNYLAAIFVFGLLPLSRTDSIFCVFTFPLILSLKFFNPTEPIPIRKALLVSLIFLIPILTWNFLGFLHTGSPIFIFSHGYPGEKGIYGFGNLFHYFVEFLKFDTAIFLLFVSGVLVFIISQKSRCDSPFFPLILALLSYFSAMTFLWTTGSFGSAGLLRYFVFALPGFALVAGLAIDPLLSHFTKLWSRDFLLLFMIFFFFHFLGLHWLIRFPEWHHGLLSSLPVNQASYLTDFITIVQLTGKLATVSS